MSETAFAQLTKTATELDEAIAEVERGEYSTYDSFDELLEDAKNK